jgi:hypothetical protein
MAGEGDISPAGLTSHSAYLAARSKMMARKVTGRTSHIAYTLHIISPMAASIVPVMPTMSPVTNATAIIGLSRIPAGTS